MRFVFLEHGKGNRFVRYSLKPVLYICEPYLTFFQ